MTTDYSQLLPKEDFTEPKTRRTAPYWIGLGLLALGASGYATLSALGLAASDAPDDAWLQSPAATPGAGELQAASDAVFLEDSESDDLGPALPPGQAAPTLADATSQAEPEAVGDANPTLASSDADVVADAAATAVSATEGAYYIQVASYRTKERADEHASRLSERGLATQSVAYGGPEAGWWHAVRMGPFKERIEAEKRRFDLEVHERRNAYVLPRSNGKYHVQVASFAEREEAEQVRKRFDAEGHRAKVTRVKMSGTYWHCVRIGPFDDRAEASAYKSLVADIPGSQSTVIPFGPPSELAHPSDDQQN